MKRRLHSKLGRMSSPDRRGEVGGFDLLLLGLLFFCVVLGISLGIEMGARFGVWGKVIGGFLGPVVAIVVAFLALFLLFRVLDPFDRLISRFIRWWRPYPPVCENGCCDRYSDYQISKEVMKRVKGMAGSGYECCCGNVYVVGCDFPMLNRFARLLPDGTVHPYLRHRIFGRWRPDDGTGIVYLTGDEEAKPPIEIPGWLLPVVLALLSGGIGYYVVYIESETTTHPIAPWFVGALAIVGFVIGCVVRRRSWEKT